MFHSISLVALAATSLFSFATTSPVKRAPESADEPFTLSQFTCPLSNGSATLPAPQSLTLTAVAIGRGTQNYTCADTAATTVPKATGAKATLFDASPPLKGLSRSEGTALLDLLPALALSIPTSALVAADFAQLGVHYFNADGDPTFDLTSSDSGFLVAAKDGDIAAPPNATAGAHGAVDWLTLAAKGGTEGSLVRAYRTMTAGGKPPKSCDGQDPEISVEYAAQYFFFSTS